MLVTTVSCLLLAALVNCHSSYMEDIPNGDKVPKPGNPGSYWEAVGHTTPDDGDGLNAFGRDFKSAGKTWSTQLCQKDSDGDGLSNGEELGDPECVWQRGATPAGPAKGHPGYSDNTGGQGVSQGVTVPGGVTVENEHHKEHEKEEEHHHSKEKEHEKEEEHHHSKEKEHEKEEEHHHSKEKEHEKEEEHHHSKEKEHEKEEEHHHHSKEKEHEKEEEHHHH